jgi:uncharacterized protein YbaR (Trm112 family)
MACPYCKGTGRLRKPRSYEDFDYYYDKYYNSGQFDTETAKEMAFGKIKYDIVPCPHCRSDLQEESI